MADFDGGTSINPLSAFNVTFAAGSKTLAITNGPSGQGPWQISPGSANRVPISGASTTTPAYLGKGTGNSGADFDFQIGAITGGAADEKVTAIGVTWCSRSDGNATVTATAYLADVSGTPAGTIATNRAVTSSAGGQDTFFGFRAPAGYQITRLLIDSSGGFSSVDDLGFTTAVITPPPKAPVIAVNLPLATSVAPNTPVNLAITLEPGTYPTPAWQWEFDAAPQDNIFENVAAIEGGNDPTLSFTSSPEKEGTYRVTATNSQGSAPSTACVFTVARAAPAITTDLLPLYQPVLGAALSLFVSINNNVYPEPTLQWYRNDVMIPVIDGGDSPVLNLIADPSSDGSYKLVITNSEGSVTSTIATVAHLADTDGDTLADIWETNTGIFVSNTNTGTSPILKDTDGDTIDDDVEIFTYRTNPNLTDTDGDGLSDDAEIFTHLTNPLLADTDLDGVNDGAELTALTNPLWFSNGYEWRPGGNLGGPGTWNNSASDWFDGEVPPGTTNIWADGKAALFTGSLGAATVVNVDGTRNTANLVFTQTGGTYRLVSDPVNTGALGLTGTVHLGTNDGALILPLINSTGITVAGNPHGSATTASGALLVFGDQTATMSGSWTIKPGAMLRPDSGGVSLGSGSTVAVQNGGLLRLFSDEADTVPQTFSQNFTVSGQGFVSSGTTAGAILFRDAHQRTFSGSLLLAANAGIKMDGGTWIQDGLVGLAPSVTGADLRIAQNGATATFNNSVNLGTGRLASGNLPLPIAHANAAGGTIVLNSAANTFAGITLDNGIIRADLDGAIPDGIDVVQNGGTLNLNGFPVAMTSITGTGGTLATGAAALTATSLSGTGGQVTVGSLTTAGSFSLNQTSDITSGKMIQVADFPGCIFTKQGAGKLTLTGNNNQGGSVNGLWVIEQGVLELAANQPQFGTIRSGGTVRVKSGASILVSNINALHGFDNGGTRYILESGASMTTTDDTTTHATNITLEGGTLASGLPDPTYGSFDLLSQANNSSRMIVNGATTSLITATDMRPSRVGGYEIEVADGAAAIDLDVTGSFNVGPVNPVTSLPYNGAGGLIKSGPGTMRLAAASTHTYQGPTSVSGGTLLVDGSVTGTSSITVAAEATLAGSGSVAGNLSGAGTIAPGGTNGTATLSISNDANLSGMTLSIEIDESKAPDNDTLVVAGALNVSAATLNLNITGSPTQAVYIIATYNSLAPGNFAAVNNRPAGYQIDYAYNSGTAIALVSNTTANYETWAAANGIPNQPFGGDVDGDGLRNGVEYAIAGLNPDGSDGFPGTFANGTITFTKRPEAVANGDVSYGIETSTTLAAGSWTVVTPQVNNATTLSYTLPTDEGKIFARLVVSTQP